VEVEEDEEVEEEGSEEDVEEDAEIGNVERLLSQGLYRQAFQRTALCKGRRTRESESSSADEISEDDSAGGADSESVAEDDFEAHTPAQTRGNSEASESGSEEPEEPDDQLSWDSDEAESAEAARTACPVRLTLSVAASGRVFAQVGAARQRQRAKPWREAKSRLFGAMGQAFEEAAKKHKGNLEAAADELRCGADLLAYSPPERGQPAGRPPGPRSEYCTPTASSAAPTDTY
jgi:hypothetical protein